MLVVVSSNHCHASTVSTARCPFDDPWPSLLRSSGGVAWPEPWCHSRAPSGWGQAGFAKILLGRVAMGSRVEPARFPTPNRCSTTIASPQVVRHGRTSLDSTSVPSSGASRQAREPSDNVRPETHPGRKLDVCPRLIELHAQAHAPHPEIPPESDWGCVRASHKRWFSTWTQCCLSARCLQPRASTYPQSWPVFWRQS
jgi:hypothetical protein